MARQHAGDRVHLRVFETGLQPETADGQAVPGGRLDHLRARLARRVGVVEDKAPPTEGDLPLELGDEPGQPAAALVAVEPQRAVTHPLLGERALAGRGHAHHQHDLAGASRHGRSAAAFPAELTRGGNALVETPAVLVVEGDRGGAHRGQQRLDARRARDRHDQRRQLPQPRERDLEGRRGVTRRELDEHRVAREPRAPVAPAERPIREQRDLLGEAARRDPVPKAVVVEHAQLDLHGVDLGEAERLLELAQAHVGEADPFDRPVALERGKRADARGERHARVGRVELVERDALDLERTSARGARGDQAPGAAVRQPAAVGPGEAALRRDQHGSPVALPRGERASEEPLVVAHFGRVVAVCVGGIEKIDTGLERSSASAVVSSRPASVESRMQPRPSLGPSGSLSSRS